MVRTMLKWPLHGQIFAALALAALIGTAFQLAGSASATGAGAASGAEAGPAVGDGADMTLAAHVSGVAEFVGSLFVNALKMIVVPLISTSIICGVMRLGAEKNVGRLSAKTALYYVVSGAIAVIIGLAVVNVIGPGRVDADIAGQLLAQGETSATANAETIAAAADRDLGDIAEVFQRMIPANVIDAATSNRELLALIFFSVLFGFFIGKLPDSQRDFQEKLWESLQNVILKLTNFVLAFAPIGVFALVLPILIRTNFIDLLGTLLLFFLTVVIALLLHFVVSMSVLLAVVGKVNPMRHYAAMAPVLLTAFSTASSSGTLPLTMKTVQQASGVSSRTSSFVLPLGATVNMDGTALYECVVVLFIAQLYGVLEGFSLGLGGQLMVVVLALTTSIGVAGIPAASLTAIIIILGVVGLPPEAIGVVWITDRILDMCRTAVNVFSDTVGATIIAKSEGEPVYAEPAS